MTGVIFWVRFGPRLAIVGLMVSLAIYGELQLVKYAFPKIGPGVDDIVMTWGLVGMIFGGIYEIKRDI